MMRWLCALAVGVTLTISEHNGPWWITVALLSLATIVFGVWGSKSTRDTTIFWHASGPMFVAVAIVGIMHWRSQHDIEGRTKVLHYTSRALRSNAAVVSGASRRVSTPSSEIQKPRAAMVPRRLRAA